MGAVVAGREKDRNMIEASSPRYHANLQSYVRLELSANSLNLASAAGRERTGLQLRHCLCKALGAQLCCGREGEAWASSTVINQGTGITLGANLWSSFSLCAQRMKLIAKLTSKSPILYIWDNPSRFCFLNSNLREGRKAEGFQPLSNPAASPLSYRSVNSYMGWGLFAFISLCSMCPQPFANRCFALWKGKKRAWAQGKRERESKHKHEHEQECCLQMSIRTSV